MPVEHLLKIHLVKLVARQNEIIAVLSVAFKVVHIFAHRVRRALIPVSAGVRLFGCENIDKSAVERVEFVGLLNVFVQGRRVELGEKINAIETRIYAIAYRNINESVFTRERDGRFATMFCEGV